MKAQDVVRQDIREQLEKTVAELQGTLHDQLEIDHAEHEHQRGGQDSTEEAMQAADIEMEMTQTSRTGYQLILTREALKKLDDGTFGACEDCGEQIGSNRLMANPIAKRCIPCQTSHEYTQKQKDATPSL